MTIQTQLEEAVAQASADSDLLHQIVHGSSTSTVVTDGGPVRAIAKLIADKDEEINLAADGLLAQSTALATSASVSAAAAAASESAASTSEQHALISETAAQNSQMAAAISESQAAVSATNAADSQAMALAHQMAAASSESAAANSEANALAYQTAAQASQQAAATSESNAAASAVSAASSAASAAAALDNFDDRYLGPKPQDPYVDNDGNALLTGALYFNTDTGVMKIYTASGWIAASSATVATLATFEFVASAGQTDFSSADVNGVQLSYLAGAVLVTLNGVRLRPGEDFLASTGNSILLVSAASAGDELIVDAFGNFLVADTYSRVDSDARFVNASGDAMTGPLGVLGNATGRFGSGVSIRGAMPELHLRRDDGNGEGGVLLDDAGSQKRMWVGTYNSDGPLHLGTNGIDRLRIDTAGRVSLPFQPVFRGVFAEYFNASNFTPYVYTSFVQGGLVVNEAASSITVPVAGKYLVTAQQLLSTTSSVYLYLRVNGVTYCHGYVTNSMQDIFVSSILNLQANDSVSFFYGGTITSQCWTSGHSSVHMHLIG